MAYIMARPNGRNPRGRKPVPASIHAAPAEPHPDGTIVAEISAESASGRHRILMSSTELDQLVTNLAPAISLRARLEIAAASLHELDDSRFLALICDVLHGREKPSGVLKP